MYKRQAKFSANIISATVYLFAGSPCSWVVEGADPYGFGQSFLALSVYSQIKLIIFLKVFAKLFSKSGKVFAQPFTKGWEKRPKLRT